MTSKGYLLPVVVALGLGISVVGVLALQTVAQNSGALQMQAYKMIAHQAAKAGVVAAQKCLSDSTTSATTVWPLKAADCTGASGPLSIVKTSDANGDYSSSFSVEQPVSSTLAGNSGMILTAVGTVRIRGGGSVTDTVRAFMQMGDDNRHSLNVQKVSTGPTAACVIATQADGSGAWPYCWGDNTNGQLGIGYYLGGIYDSSGYSTLPMKVADGTVPAHSATDQKHFVCNGWQTSWFGCLSLGSYTVTNVYVPPSPGGTSAIKDKVTTDISVGTNHACVIARDSQSDAKSAKAYCWGKNTYGQLGTRTNDDSLLPVAIDVKAAYSITIPGYCNGTSNPFTGCAFPTGTWVPAQTTNYPASALNNKTVVSITAGNYFTCAKYVDQTAVTNGVTSPAQAAALPGAIACWGDNDNGELGNNSRDAQNIPVNVDMTSASSALKGKQIKTLGTVKSGSTMCATDTSDSAYCWGTNYAGQAGDASYPSYEQLFWACGWTFGDRYPAITTSYDRLLPKAVVVPAGVKFQSLATYDGWTVGVTTATATPNATAAYYWGGTTSVGCGVLNAAARFYHGNDPAPVILSPTDGVRGPTGGGATDTSVLKVGAYAAGNFYAGPYCAMLTGTNLTCAGMNPAPSDPSIPLNKTTRLADRTITSIDVGVSGYACMVTATSSKDGQVDCWGKNEQGQLGNRMLASRTTPFPVDTYRPNDPNMPSSALGAPGLTISNVVYF